MKNKKNEIIEKKHKNLFLRLVSGFLLLIIFGIYISFAILNNELWVHNANKTLSFIFGGLFIVSTFIFLILCYLEISKVFKFKNKLVITLLIIIGLGVYLLPFGGVTKLQNSLFIYSYSAKLIAFLANPFLQAFSFLVLVGIFILIGKSNGLNLIDSIWLTFLLMIIALGFKGFTLLSLSVDYSFTNDAKSYNVLKYSYLTGIWIWIATAMTDTFAYVFGSLFGKHKMAPNISPKKSWEGSIGGFCSSVLISLSLAFGIYFSDAGVNVFNTIINSLNTGLAIFLFIMLAILISILAQIGDLLFSFVKRKAGIKDFSSMIPGHGGILDRMDSFIFVFFVFFIITLFM